MSKFRNFKFSFCVIEENIYPSSVIKGSGLSLYVLFLPQSFARALRYFRDTYSSLNPALYSKATLETKLSEVALIFFSSFNKCTPRI